MFFVLSKLFWFFARPLNLLFLAMVASMLLARMGAVRFARMLFATSALLFALFGFTQLPDAITHALESVVPPVDLPADPAGIIVLGGGLTANTQAGHVAWSMAESGDRLITGLTLKRRFPQARLIFSGGLGDIVASGRPEADAALALVRDLTGSDLGIELEAESRNTAENAAFVARMTSGDRERPWLLVTSATHMPRALGCFRAAGMAVIPVPTDYRADPIAFPFITGNMADQFLKLNLVVKELIGLVAYRMTGRIDTLLPR